MNLSYQEKSIWGSTVAILLVFGWYFATTPVFRTGGLSRSDRLGHMARAVILLILVEIVYQTVVALKWRTEPKDERDLQIEGKAFRNAYFLLASGALAAMPAVMIVGAISEPGSQLISPYLAIDILLLFLVAAELTKSATQLFYYRRGL